VYIFRASLKKAEEDDFDSFLDFDGDTATKVFIAQTVHYRCTYIERDQWTILA
jgi:hypothetical protein